MSTVFVDTTSGIVCSRFRTRSRSAAASAALVAMLGLGRIIDRPWVVGSQVVPRKIAQLSLVFDHRICDGGVAGGFLRFVADRVESPLGALADL